MVVDRCQLNQGHAGDHECYKLWPSGIVSYRWWAPRPKNKLRLSGAGTRPNLMPMVPLIRRVDRALRSRGEEVARGS